MYPPLSLGQMELQIRIVGVLLMGLACLHIIFPKYFDWKNDLSGIQLINQSLMKVHTFFIGLIVFMMGLLCFTSSEDLLQTSLGNKICLGLGIFWLIRLLFQFFVYPSALWKGKKFETTIHILAVIFWGYLCYVFIFGYFSSISS